MTGPDAIEPRRRRVVRILRPRPFPCPFPSLTGRSSTTVSRYSPNTSRSASEISPSVASAFTAARMGGIRFSGPLRRAAHRLERLPHRHAVPLAAERLRFATCRSSSAGSTLMTVTGGSSDRYAFTPTTTFCFASTCRCQE